MFLCIARVCCFATVDDDCDCGCGGGQRDKKEEEFIVGNIRFVNSWKADHVNSSRLLRFYGTKSDYMCLYVQWQLEIVWVE